jgi:eukaryotic-like serine/threonine-protein kinase
MFLRRYKVVRLLGQGGTGCAYLASQSNPDRLVVVKTLHEKLAANAHYRNIFQQEIDCLSRFRHPYAVELYEASMDGPDGPCLVMEYVDGQPLDAVLARDGPFPLARIGRLLGRLCAVLQAAHDRGIVHRDLKPANIMVVGVTTADESLKVLDFGLARQIGDPTRGLYLPLEKFVGSHVHKAVGTPEYACPEQFRGDEVDHRGDLYSVGVMLFELLTGRRPFQRAISAQLVGDHLYATPPPLSPHGAEDVPPALETLVHACLAKYPGDRPQSARQLALSYGEVLGSSIWEEQEAMARDSVPAAEPTKETGDEDENADVFRLEAWMPESIAAVKLRGFVDDRGEVSASAPGRLKVRLRMPRPVVASPRPSGLMARLRLGRTGASPPAFDLVDMDVLVQRKDASRPSDLLITVRLHPPEIRSEEEPDRWLDWCKRVQVDLAAYLMARKVDEDALEEKADQACPPDKVEVPAGEGK